MEGKKRNCSWSFIFMVYLGLTLVLACNLTKVGCDNVRPSQCKKEWQLVKNRCMPVVFGQPATPACCVRMRVSHFECLCPKFSPKVASLLNVNQTIKLLQGCGRRVPRHFKCGSLNFP